MIRGTIFKQKADIEVRLFLLNETEQNKHRSYYYIRYFAILGWSLQNANVELF